MSLQLCVLKTMISMLIHVNIPVSYCICWNGLQEWSAFYSTCVSTALMNWKFFEESFFKCCSK